MGFFGDLWDNMLLVDAALIDVLTPTNWFTGNAPVTAYVAEYQNAQREGREFDSARAEASAEGGLSTLGGAVTTTARDVDERIAKGVSFLPWVLGAAAIIALAVVAAPYVRVAAPSGR